MNTVRIVADSTCDLTKELVEKYDIKIIPLCIVMDDKSYYDGEDVTPEEIFKWADANKTTPKTAAIPFDKAEAIFKPYMDAGDDIIFFGISSKMNKYFISLVSSYAILAKHLPAAVVYPVFPPKTPVISISYVSAVFSKVL